MAAYVAYDEFLTGAKDFANITFEVGALADITLTFEDKVMVEGADWTFHRNSSSGNVHFTKTTPGSGTVRAWRRTPAFDLALDHQSAAHYTNHDRVRHARQVIFGAEEMRHDFDYTDFYYNDSHATQNNMWQGDEVEVESNTWRGIQLPGFDGVRVYALSLTYHLDNDGVETIVHLGPLGTIADPIIDRAPGFTITANIDIGETITFIENLVFVPQVGDKITIGSTWVNGANDQLEVFGLKTRLLIMEIG